MRKRCKRKVWALVNPVEHAINGAGITSRKDLDSLLVRELASGPGIQALRSVIEWHDLQRSAIPRSQYEEAIRLTAARIKSGHATIDLGKTLKRKETA